MDKLGILNIHKITIYHTVNLMFRSKNNIIPEAFWTKFQIVQHNYVTNKLIKLRNVIKYIYIYIYIYIYKVFMMKKNYIILKNIFDIFVFVNSYLFTIKTVTKSCFTIKLDNYRGNRITKKIINVTIRTD